MTHLGSGASSEIHAALDTLAVLVKDDFALVHPVSSLLYGILDFLDAQGLHDEHKRKILTIFAGMTYHDDLETHVQSDLGILITKQLSNPDPKYKRLGIMGAVIIIAFLGSTKRRTKQLEAATRTRRRTDICMALYSLFRTRFRF